MAITNTFTPFMAQLSFGAPAAGQDLYTLLHAIFTSVSHKAAWINIQLDISAAGVTCYVGNSNVSTTVYGSQLSAGQALVLGPFESNLLVLDQIFLLSSSGTIKANVSVVTR